jgi:ABC-2 type transport system ATP-binding protein
MSAVIDVRDVHRSFGDRRALFGVSLTVRRKEIYLLLGPNGAGKSSLVRAICGRLALDRGTVRVGGDDPRRHRKARRGLGLVPQEIALYAELTTRQNLEIFGRLAGVSRTDLPGAVDDALSWAGLESRRDDRVGYLSGGMQRRLNMAAGMIHRPDVLILDEPTVGVDPEARETS